MACRNILKKNLNTTCITVNCGMWHHVQLNQLAEVYWAWRLLKQAFSEKVEIKTTWEVVSTCELLWSARLNTSKVTENWQVDFSSQWEATNRSVGLMTARVVDAQRDPSQRRWIATVRHLICIRDVRKPNFGSVSVYKNPNRTEPNRTHQTRTTKRQNTHILQAGWPSCRPTNSVKALILILLNL